LNEIGAAFFLREWLRVRHTPGVPFSSMQFQEPDDKLIRMLLPRLERISVDSYWAHRASGVRGALTKILDQLETGVDVDPAVVKINLAIGFEILREAAEEYT
jgi:hypothetical protein